ncbi:MAG: NAD(+)/NADH kinase [Coriobacteriales bacterium]|jgi:NAD+ kinase|nr:NAD(+)/NADH kinase [Coriobacteriales bacterium]
MKVLLIANNSKDLASRALEEVRAWLDAQGHVSVMASKGSFDPSDPEFCELSSSVASFDLVCAFGGDGTILQSARIIGSSRVPLLGYNFGRLGFLAGAAGSDLIPALEAALEGRARFDERTMLIAEISLPGGGVVSHLALNEMAISRGNFGRIVSLDLHINRHFIDSVSGDGLIVSTATGSTAYALSAGGPFIAPSYGGLCIVPVSPHTLNARSILLAPDDVITVTPNASNRQRVILFFDGEPMGSDGGSSGAGIVNVTVRACPERLRLLRFGDDGFYEQITRTFFRRGSA